MIEVLRPECAVMRDPCIGCAERRPHQATSSHATDATNVSEPRALKDAHVFGHTRQRHVEERRQLPDRTFAARQVEQDGASGRIGERPEGAVERGRHLR